MAKEIRFDVIQEEDGGFVAEAVGEDMVTQADTWEGLKANVLEVVKGYYIDAQPPERVWLRLVRDEVLAVS